MAKSFGWVANLLVYRGLMPGGSRCGVMPRRESERGDAVDCPVETGDSYEEFLRGLAKALGDSDAVTGTVGDLAGCGKCLVRSFQTRNRF
jgi:hypothetical protein